MQKYVEFKRDNLTLRGMAHIPDNISKKVPAIIMFHGFTASRVGFSFQFVKIARELEKYGIATFRFDLTGSGESDGDFIDVTLTSELEDGKAIIDYVKSLDFIDETRIGLMGMSFGGLIASMLGGIRKDDIKALYIASPATCAIDDIKSGHVQGCPIDEEAKLKGYVDLKGLKVGLGYAEDCVKYNPYEIAKDFDKNVLIMHIEGDPMVPVECAEKYLDIYKDRAKFVPVKGNSHSYDNIEKMELLQNNILEFFSDESIL